MRPHASFRLLQWAALCVLRVSSHRWGSSIILDTTLTLSAEILGTQLSPPADALTSSTFVAVTFLPTYFSVWTLGIAWVPAACSSGTGTISVSLWSTDADFLPDVLLVEGGGYAEAGLRRSRRT